MGNFIELEEKYGLLYSFTDEKAGLQKAEEILQNSTNKAVWKIRREQLLKDKMDVSAFMVWFIEHYPRSFTAVKENPEILSTFVPGT